MAKELRALGAVVLLLACAASLAVAAARDDKNPPPYGLIYGTVYGPDSRPLYGVPVKIRRADKKKAQWELFSDHQGEFAQRVPPGPADYIVWTDVDLAKFLGTDKSKGDKQSKRTKNGDKPLDDPSSSAASPAGSSASAAPKSIREVKVHVESQERVDMGLHLTE